MICVFFGVLWFIFGGITIWSYIDNFEYFWIFLIFPVLPTIIFGNLMYGWIKLK